MDFNKNDIEFYLLTKDYDSLTKEELTFVKEAVETEEEYNSLRQLLLVMKEAPEEELLVPNPQIKENLVTAFEKARFQKGVTATTSTKLIDIKDEKKRKKSVFIWLSIAASIAILVGLFMRNNNLFNNESNDQMAELKQEELVELESENTKKQTPKLIENLDAEEEIEEIVSEDNLSEPAVSIPEVTNKREKFISEDKNNVFLSKSKVKNDFGRSAEAEYEEVIGSNSFGDLNSKLENSISNESTTSSAIVDMELADEVAVSAPYDLDDNSYVNKKDKVSSPITKSVSLKEDKDMLSLLYTAL